MKSKKSPFNLELGSSLRFSSSLISDSYVISYRIPDILKEELKNKEIDTKKLNLVCEVNCSATLFRRSVVHESFEDPKEIRVNVPIEDVAIKFNVMLFLIVKDPFELGGFELIPGQELGYLGTETFNVDNRSQSLIEFSENEVTNQIEYAFSEHAIQVKIPTAQFNYIKNKRYSTQFKAVFVSPFTQVALLQGSQYLKNEEKNHLNWFKELKNKWKQFNPDDDYPSTEEQTKFIDFVLKDPSLKLLDTLIKNDKNTSYE